MEKDYYIDSLEFLNAIKKRSTFEIQSLENRSFLERIPKHLYKYRKSGSKGRVAFYVGERRIYTASLNDQNDIFEGITPAVKEMIAKLGVEKTCIYYKDTIISILNNRFPSLDIDLSNRIFDMFIEERFNKDTILRRAKEFVKEEEQKELETVIAALTYLFRKLDTEIDKNSDFAKGMDFLMNVNDRVGAYCMCDSCLNESLWGLYADGFRGYCIEYDLTDPCRSKGSIRFVSSLYPVDYVDKKDDDWFKPLFESTVATINIDGRGDKLRSAMIFHHWLIKALCSKKKDLWASEHEWRALGDANRSYPGPLVSSIIVGHKINKQDFEDIQKCADKNGFPIKITELDYIKKEVVVRDITQDDIEKINERV